LKKLKKHQKTLKIEKATGLDGLNMEVFKYGGTILQLRLIHLSNMCYKACAIPKNWLKPKVISLFRKGNRNISGNYRGISLLDSAYKLYARILN
jgi:hypothetical protein